MGWKKLEKAHEKADKTMIEAMLGEKLPTKEELDALERGKELERFEENIELNELDTIMGVER